MLLEPKKGTQGREMHQNIKIVSALVLALALVLCALAPSVALADNPLLSGYGGPGAGEQAILGSTLLGGAGGDSGSGGSSGGSTGGGGGRAGTGTVSSAGATGGGSLASPPLSSAGSARARQTDSRAGDAATRRARERLGGSPVRRAGAPRASSGGVSAYVYPSTPRAASYDSPVLGISGGDLLAIVATIATLALLGVLTIRLGRLQA